MVPSCAPSSCTFFGLPRRLLPHAPLGGRLPLALLPLGEFARDYTYGLVGTPWPDDGPLGLSTFIWASEALFAAQLSNGCTPDAISFAKGKRSCHNGRSSFVSSSLAAASCVANQTAVLLAWHPWCKP